MHTSAEEDDNQSDYKYNTAALVGEEDSRLVSPRDYTGDMTVGRTSFKSNKRNDDKGNKDDSNRSLYPRSMSFEGKTHGSNIAKDPTSIENKLKEKFNKVMTKIDTEPIHSN
jgi:hypothetical protein